MSEKRLTEQDLRTIQCCVDAIHEVVQGKSDLDGKILSITVTNEDFSIFWTAPGSDIERASWGNGWKDRHDNSKKTS